MVIHEPLIRRPPVPSNFFYDFEFHEGADGLLFPISLGIVSDDDRELYIEFEFDEELVRATNEWVTRNILPRLGPVRDRVSQQTAQRLILDFIGEECRPILWGYFDATDWLLFYRIFGRMVDLPQHFPHWSRDLQQLWWHMGLPERIKPEKGKLAHNAIVDARWIRDLYHAIKALAVEEGLQV